MDEVLKQRLVGALVLIGLGVLLWSWVFPDPVQQTLDRTSQVPAMPELEQRRYPPPEPVAGLDPAGDRYDAVIAEEARALEKVAEAQAGAADSNQAGDAGTTGADQPALDERGIPVAWVLQVVSLSNRDKAEALVEELLAKGLKAYSRPLVRGDQTLYKVYVGPRFELQAMQETKALIDRELQVDASIMRYVP